MLGPCPPIHKSSGCNYLLDLDLSSLIIMSLSDFDKSISISLPCLGSLLGTPELLASRPGLQFA